jgi:hypothetical protein
LVPTRFRQPPGGPANRHSIPFGEEPILFAEERPRITALVAVEGAQSRRGLASDARETLMQARRLAYALKDQFGRAEAPRSIGEGESEAGMVTEAEATFQEKLRQVEESLDIPLTLSSRTTFHRAEALFWRSGAWAGQSRQHRRFAACRARDQVQYRRPGRSAEHRRHGAGEGPADGRRCGHDQGRHPRHRRQLCRR